MLKKVKEEKDPLDYDDELHKLILAKGIPGGKPDIKKVNLCFDITEIEKKTALKATAIKAYQSALKYK